MNVRYYIDPATELPHIHKHQVDESEVEDVLSKPGEIDLDVKVQGLQLEQTESGRYLRVIYVPDPEPDSIFVITAYELKDKPLFAYRRRRRSKHK